MSSTHAVGTQGLGSSDNAFLDTLIESWIKNAAARTQTYTHTRCYYCMLQLNVQHHVKKIFISVF